MFLAEQRGLHQDQFIRRYSSFNFNEYFNPHKTPFAQLFMLNDSCMVAGHRNELIADRNCQLVTVPITGAICIQKGGLLTEKIDVGEVHLSALSVGDQLSILNPYEDDLVTYLQIGIASSEIVNDHFKTGQFNIDLLNEMNPIVFKTIENEGLSYSLNIGRFSGRGEACWSLKENSMLFCYVIAGAFEIEGRLMHESDGLALWNASSIECEALSSHAILLTIELEGENPCL